MNLSVPKSRNHGDIVEQDYNDKKIIVRTHNLMIYIYNKHLEAWLI